MEESRRRRYNHQDYLSWDDERRWELIDGEPFLMAPAPRIEHQRVLTRLVRAVSQSLANSPCEALVAPVDVKLSETDVVQPDLVVVCRPEQFTEQFVEGPPTLVVEILSPSSLRHDRIRKLSLYAKFKIAEYWILTPRPAMLEVLKLDAAGRYVIAAVYTETDFVTSLVIPELRVELNEVFAAPLDFPDEVREGTPGLVQSS